MHENELLYAAQKEQEENLPLIVLTILFGSSMIVLSVLGFLAK